MLDNDMAGGGAGGTSLTNFNVLQEMWASFRDTLVYDVLRSDDFINPLLVEIQHDCIVRSLQYLDAYAIPSFDEEKMRDWVKTAKNLKSVLEVMANMATSVWLHATSATRESGFVRMQKEGEILRF